MSPQFEKPVVFGRSGDSVQNPNVPKLKLPAIRTSQTRKEKEERRKPRGLPAIDFGDFATRLGEHQRQQRLGFTRKQRRTWLEEHQKRRALRPFFPQKGIKVERVDTNANDAARLRVYLTMTNGQVVRPDRLTAGRGHGKNWRPSNPVLLRKVNAFLDAQQ